MQPKARLARKSLAGNSLWWAATGLLFFLAVVGGANQLLAQVVEEQPVGGKEKQQKSVLPVLQTIGTAELDILLPRFRSSADIGSSPFGTHTTSVFSENVGSPEQLINDISKAGFKWVKDYVPAGNLQQSQDLDSFLARWAEPWGACVEFLEMAGQAKVKVLLRLSDMREDGNEPTSPRAREAFARFCRLQVRHYKRWVKDWELCNEPNIGNLNPRLAPDEYALLANEAYEAIKAEDPEAQVYVGATAMLQCLGDWPYPWIREAVQAGLRGDVFSFHPYCQPYLRLNMPEHGSQFHPWTHWESYEAQTVELRQLLGRSVLAKGADGQVRVAATEAGWPTTVSKSTWKRQISLLTQAKYEQRAMLLDFWLGTSPRINFILTRPFTDIYHNEGQFQLVNPGYNLLEPANRYRPAYFAAAAVCSNIDDTLHKTRQEVRVTDASQLNPQIMTFEREHKDFGFAEAVIVLWAGVPADDDFEPKLVNVSIPGPTESIICAPIGYSLLPVGATHTSMDEFDFGVTNLPYELSADALTILSVPLSDAPYVIKYARKLRE